jgi:hypothetical protein
MIGLTSTLAGLAHYPGFDEDDRRLVEVDNALRMFPRVAEMVGSPTHN